jgi:hypothetical protein
MKYRIVKRNTTAFGGFSQYLRNLFKGNLIRVDRYYAQCNILGVWIDLRYHPFISTYDAYDVHLERVEKWLENHIRRGKESPTQEVVKTYD